MLEQIGRVIDVVPFSDGTTAFLIVAASWCVVFCLSVLVLSWWDNRRSRMPEDDRQAENQVNTMVIRLVAAVLFILLAGLAVRVAFERPAPPPGEQIFLLVVAIVFFGYGIHLFKPRLPNELKKTIDPE